MAAKNDKFRTLFNRYLKRAHLNQDVLAERLCTCRQTIYKRLNSNAPIDFGFLARSAAIFSLGAAEMIEYIETAGYSVAAKDVPAMGVIWDLIYAYEATIEVKNDILTKYGIDAIQ